MSAILAPQGALPLSFPTLSLGAPRRTLRPSGHSRRTGLVVVVVLHLLIGWALASGLARKAVEIVRKPVEARLIQDDVVPPPPPPPPPPPKVERIKDAPKLKAPPPPPAYVPPPEVVTAAPAPVIQAVQSEVPKSAPVVAPPAPPAPPPPPEAKPAVVKQEMNVACPGYQGVLAQALEEAVERIGLAGTVNTLIRIRGNQVVEVLPQSGPKEYHKFVVAAVKRMRCSAVGAEEVQVTLPVIFAR